MSQTIFEEKQQVLQQNPTIMDPITVLDKGFVRLVDWMGSDQRIVSSARVSYGAGTKTPSTDRALIRYLLRSGHTSPFEQVVLTFHAKMPVFVARQWVRHRTARLNEISGRYSVMKDEFYVPDPECMRGQSAVNKQARDSEQVDNADAMITEMEADQVQLYAHYEGYLDGGLAREIARNNLPLSLYTEWYWQIDLHNLFHFLKLRLDPHAQYEIRMYAQALYEYAKIIAPLACEAFECFVLNSVTFSQSDLAVLQTMLNGNASAMDVGVLCSQLMAKTEIADFFRKYHILTGEELHLPS